MTVSTPPFAPIVRIFPGGSPMDRSTWGPGRDISEDVRHPGSDGGAPIVYSSGRPDEAATADPGTMTLTLDNRDGHYSTRNPNARDFGLLRKGTPIQLSMLSGSDDFGRTVASGLGTSSGGGAWTTNVDYSTDGSTGQAALAAANTSRAIRLGDADASDFDIRCTVWPTVAATGAPLIYGLMGRWLDGNNFLNYSIEFGTASAIVLKIRKIVAGSFTDLASETLGSTYAANDKWRVRAAAVNSQLFLKAWKPANPSDPDADEPDDWNLTSTNTDVTGTEIGFRMWRYVGNTNVGTVNFKFDDLAIEALEWSGSVVSWPARWDKSGNNCWAPITAAGVLRGLSRPAQGLKSPLTRQLSTYDHTGYWPLEDAEGATSFGCLTTGVRPALFNQNVSLATDSTLPGASTSPVFGSSMSYIRAYTSKRQTGDGFAVMFLMKLAALPTDARFAYFRGSGFVVDWEIWLDSGGIITTNGHDASGALVISEATTMGNADPTEWVAYQLEAFNDTGTTIEWAMTWHQVGETTYYTHSGSDASTKSPRLWSALLGTADETISWELSGAAFAHLWIGSDTLPFVTNSFSMVSDGWRGEPAGDRIARLCDEEGIPCTVEDGDSEALGVQRVGTLLSALQSAADADYGILYETLSGIGYRPRSARYGRETTLALAVSAGEIDEPPEPVDDDQNEVNDWTVERDEGSFAQAVDSDHIALAGRSPQSARINVATDEVLVDHAGWRLYLGTRPELRWPGLSLDFARNPDLLTTWRARPAAFRLTVDTGLGQVGDEPDVIAEGYQATLWPTGWKVVLNCSSALPWDVIALDGGLRLDSASSTLAAGYDDNDTSFSVATTSDDRIWITTALHPAEFPFDAIVGGEVVTVTAITGASSPQTFTVTRSVNGVVKSHDSGAPISLAVPTYLAL